MRPITKISLLGIRLAIILLMVYWITIFAGTHLPKVPNFAPHLGDKSKHFMAFFGLAMLFCYVTNSTNLVRRFTTIGLVCMLYGAIDEMTQSFVPGRVPDVADFISDSLGIWTAIGIYATAKFFADRHPSLHKQAT